jgi:hypothetical protein
MEENPDGLAPKAGELGRLGVPAFMFPEGNNREVERVFREIARLTHGAYCRFDRGAARQLAELLRAVARSIKLLKPDEIERHPPTLRRVKARIGSFARAFLSRPRLRLPAWKSRLGPNSSIHGEGRGGVISSHSLVN